MVPLARAVGRLKRSWWTTRHRISELHMTTRRAVTYGGLSCLLAAWLASAASTTFQPPGAREPERSADGNVDRCARDTKCRRTRAASRSASQSAPTPQLPHRNPFAFQARPQPVAQPVRRADRVAPVSHRRRPSRGCR